jgi:hypothetical protein
MTNRRLATLRAALNFLDLPPHAPERVTFMGDNPLLAPAGFGVASTP